MKPTLVALVAFLSICTALPLRAAPALRTPVTAANLDPAAFAEWVDGAEKPIQPQNAKDSGHAPQWVLWTDKSVPGHSGLVFGASKTPGERHLRIGFKTPLAAGAVLTRGGGRLSVLKLDAAYPGDMNDEAQWIPAQRIKEGGVSRDEVGRDAYVLWTLPRTVATRALRFTHQAEITDREYAGRLEGACVLAERVANVATQAVATASVNERNAKRVINENIDPVWEQWSNIPLRTGERAQVVSPDSAEWVMLMWPAPVKLRGLGAVFAGFSEAEAQVYTGPGDVHPREASESAWKTVQNFAGLKMRYPSTLGVDWLDFGREVTTRAVRVRMTRAIRDGAHPHTHGHARDGKRVWIGELLALQALGDAELQTALLPLPEETEKPPVAVQFTLPEDGWVTLVIEDENGKRVRNLIADTFHPKGEHTAWWDGSDDLGRDPAAAQHGIYYIPAQLVQPGNYRVRGLWRRQVDLKYEFGVYTAGSPPWETVNKAGGWLSNHTPPSAALYVPDGGKGEPSVLIGSYVSEGTAGLAWVDLNGKRWKGQNWVGGTWTGAPYLTRDAGPKAVPDVYAYVGAAWSAGTDPKAKPVRGEIRLTALTFKEDRPVVKYLFTPPPADHVSWEAQIGGLAAHDGVIVVSLPQLNRLLFVDARAGKVLGEATLESPRGLAFDPQGRLFALSGTRLVRFPSATDPAKLTAPETLATACEDPRGITLDEQGNIFVSDRGQSHQVKVFSPQGKLARAYGKPGVPKAGPYDPLHMNNPHGLTVDSHGLLWVAEEDSQPKRVSVWNPDGTLARAFYGPPSYGGGGSIDPQDKTRYYYQGMEFRLDWDKGFSEINNVYYRRGPEDLPLAFRSGSPETAIYLKGRRYFTNCYNSSPTGGHGTAFLFLDKDGIAVPVAAAGHANDWNILKADAFQSAWPPGTDPKAATHTPKTAFFLWSDQNGDGQVQPNEVAMIRAQSGGVTVMRDLSFVVSRVDGKAMRFAPRQITSQGVPVYDLAAGQVLAEEASPPPSSGGDQALTGPDGWTIHTTAPKPYRPQGFAGSKNGVPLWTYPSLWPGLHASHEAPVPDRPGVVIGHTRLLGDFIRLRGGEPMWLLNGNHGTIYVFTADGLFVAQLFQDMRLGRHWAMPLAQRGMVLNDMTPSDENFWPSVTQTPDGEVYLVAGRPNCIVRVEGLDSVRRLPSFDLQVTPEDLNRAREYFVRVEAARQAAQGRGVLSVALRSAPPTVDGQLDDWADASWVDIDKRGVRAYFNSKSQPYNVTGAVAVAGGRLYAAWHTNDKDLLRNSGEVPNALFKTGGALDLMLGTNPAANPKRSAPVPGDQRLLITQVAGKTRALLYRAVVPGTKQPVPFSSPGRTVAFDRVEDVSEQVQLAGSEGNYEISVPLALLGLKPAPGEVIRGDIGILRGNGTTTTQRVYWSNKATAIVADVPSEAELRPNLWGRWEFQGAK